MLESENITTGAPRTCSECGITPKLQVLRSAAGYYIGIQCNCGPDSRESLYYHANEIADEALRKGDWAPRVPEDL